MTDTRLILEELKLIKQMFASGTIRWHVLSINPLDLPPVDNEYGNFSRDVLDQDGNPVWYNYNEKRFENSDGETDILVKAWCEIPKFNPEGAKA